MIIIFIFQSGSTGNPKGVVLTHFNLVNCLISLLCIATHAVGKVQVHIEEQGWDSIILKLKLVGIWNPDQSGFWMVENRLGYKCPRCWMGSEIRELDHLKFGQMAAILPKPFEILTKTSGFWTVQFSNGWDQSYSSSIWNQTFKMLGFQMFQDLKWLDFRSLLYLLFRVL